MSSKTNEAKKAFVVTGATGHIGSRVARGLLSAGHHVRAIGRDRARLGPLVDLGAAPFVGDVRDAAFLEKAFDGADAALLVSTADHKVRDFRRDFADIGERFATAARATKLRSAVFISSQGAHDERYRGLIMVHADVERALDAVPGLNVVHLRSAFFFENLFYFVPASRARGALSSPLAPDTRIDMVGTQDVATKALQLLVESDFRGKTVLEFHGPEVLTMREIAQKTGQQLGRSFGVTQEPYEANVEAVIASGCNRDFATLMNDTWKVFNNHGLLRPDEASAVKKGMTLIETFIRDEYAPAFQAG
jgi:uncharacterized protein YbjT (DUF2867 family)